jgi:hypothetical protein
MGQVQLKGLGKLKNFSDLTGSQTHDLLARSIGPQPTMLPHTPAYRHANQNLFSFL